VKEESRGSLAGQISRGGWSNSCPKRPDSKGVQLPGERGKGGTRKERPYWGKALAEIVTLTEEGGGIALRMRRGRGVQQSTENWQD